MEAQAFNAQEQCGMPTASNEGFYLDFAQSCAGDAAAERHGRKLTETKNSVANMENKTSKLSNNMIRQKKCIILITITFTLLLGVGLVTVYMLTKNQETQPIGNVGVDNKSLANFVQYVDGQSKYITQLKLRIHERQVNSTNKRLEEHGMSEGDLKQVNKTALEQLQTATNQLKSVQECLIKDSVMEAEEKNYTTVDGKLLGTATAPGLKYPVAYSSVCAEYWSTIAQIKKKNGNTIL
ncbi:uncharacterized protein LOC144430625 [Styela clava]